MILSDKKKDFDYTRVKRDVYAEMKTAHYHPYYEIYYLVSGTRKFFIDNTIYTVKKGDLIIIPTGAIHRVTYISNDTHERIVICFSDKFIEDFTPHLDPDAFNKCICNSQISIPHNRREYIENLLEKIEHENSGIDKYSSLMLKIHFEELLLFIMRYQENADSPEKNIEIEDEIISNAARYIFNNYASAITLNDMAERFNMSPSYFSRKFKHCTGIGFKEYLNTIRIREAASLLLSSDLSISEIAEKCGYEDSNYFGDCFKKIKGISPREYRKAAGIM